MSRSPEPGVRKGETTNINLPKLMIDGKTAYYICKLCRSPVGNLISWLEHKNKIEHRTKFQSASVTEKMDQVVISGSLSVVHMFDGSCTKCLPCNENFSNREELQIHERLLSHKIAVRSREIKDREEVGIYGEKFTTLHYCELCSICTCDSLTDHQATPSHQQRLRETRQCHYCPLRLQPALLASHVDSSHPHTDFQCKKCPAKFVSGENLLEHAALHTRRRLHSYEELEEMDMFIMPTDLR